MKLVAANLGFRGLKNLGGPPQEPEFFARPGGFGICDTIVGDKGLEPFAPCVGLDPVYHIAFKRSSCRDPVVGVDIVGVLVYASTSLDEIFVRPTASLTLD